MYVLYIYILYIYIYILHIYYIYIYYVIYIYIIYIYIHTYIQIYKTIKPIYKFKNSTNQSRNNWLDWLVIKCWLGLKIG